MSIINKDKISGFFEKNLKLFLQLLGLALLGGAGAAVFFHFQSKKERDINEILYERKSQLERAGKKTNGEDYNSKELSYWVLSQNKETVYSEEMKQAAARFEKALRQYRKAKISVYFVMDLADFYFKSGQREKARSLLELFSERKRFSTVYQLLHLQLASFYMEDKLCEKALEVLKEAVRQKRAGIFDTEVYFKRGLCYEELNQKEKARLAYQKVIDKAPDSPSALRAKDYILTMRLKEKEKANSTGP